MMCPDDFIDCQLCPHYQECLRESREKMYKYSPFPIHEDEPTGYITEEEEYE